MPHYSRGKKWQFITACIKCFRPRCEFSRRPAVQLSVRKLSHVKSHVFKREIIRRLNCSPLTHSHLLHPAGWFRRGLSGSTFPSCRWHSIFFFCSAVRAGCVSLAALTSHAHLVTPSVASTGINAVNHLVVPSSTSRVMGIPALFTESDQFGSIRVDSQVTRWRFFLFFFPASRLIFIDSNITHISCVINKQQRCRSISRHPWDSNTRLTIHTDSQFFPHGSLLDSITLQKWFYTSINIYIRVQPFKKNGSYVWPGSQRSIKKSRLKESKQHGSSSSSKQQECDNSRSCFRIFCIVA